MALLKRQSTKSIAPEETPLTIVSAPIVATSATVAQVESEIAAFKAGLQQMAADIAAKEDSYTLAPNPSLLDEIMRLAKKLELESKRLPLLEQRLQAAKVDEAVAAHEEHLYQHVEHIDELTDLLTSETSAAVIAAYKALVERQMYLRRVVNFEQRTRRDALNALPREIAPAVIARVQAMEAPHRDKLDKIFAENGKGY